MKLKVWLSLAMVPLTAISILAQPSAPPPPPAPVIEAAPPAPGTNATKKAKVKAKAKTKKTTKAKPASETKAKAKKSKSAKKAKTAEEKKPEVKSGSMVLNPPATAMVKCDVLDVRGQDSFAGEVVTHLKKGETVTVYEQLTHAKKRANEPTQWSRIALPTNTPVWVDAQFVDPETKAVKATKLNVRGGPGENYSVLARIDKGTVVKELRKQHGWMEIETPTNAFAFVASEYLESAPEAPSNLAVASPAPAPAPEPPPQPVIVNVPQEAPPAAPAKPAEAAAPVPAPGPVGIAAPAPTPESQRDQELAAERRANSPQPAAVTPDVANPAPELGKEEPIRTVTREGFVHRSYNIQSPTDFELEDVKTDELLEYLQPPATLPAKKFKGFVGKRIRVTGTESLDKRWPRTPILKVESIDPL